MSKPIFKTFIVILIVSAIASTSGQQDGGSTQVITQGPGAVREPGGNGRGSGVRPGGGNGGNGGNSGSSGSNGNGSSTSGTGGGGLINGIISIPSTLLSVILSPIRALLSFLLGSIGNLVGTILNLVITLLRTILTPIGYIVGLPLDAIVDTVGGIGGAVGNLLRGILSLVASILGGGGNGSGSTLSIAGPAASTRVRRDLVMEAIMGRSL